MLKKITLAAVLAAASTIGAAAQTVDSLAVTGKPGIAETTETAAAEVANEATETARPKAFTIGGEYVGDFYGNALGGIQTGVGFLGKANLTLTLDTEAAGMWRGGEFVVGGNAIHGKSPTWYYLGDWQVASNIDGGGNWAYVQDIFYRQWFNFRKPGTGLTFTIGLQDMCAEFMVIEHAYRFLNSSFGVPSTAATGTPLPIFPQSGLGITASWNIDGRHTLKAAVYDGYSTPLAFGNPANMKWSMGRDDGVLVLGEFQSRTKVGRNKLHGEFKIGGYYHSGLRADEETEEGVREKVDIFPYNWGLYLTADQQVYNSPRHELCIFAQANAGPRRFNENNYYAGLGFNLTGVFSRQKRDAMGIAAAHAGLWMVDANIAPILAPGMEYTPRPVWMHETTLELYYKYRFNEHIVLQPDLQYIINPMGTGVALPNALLCTLRVKLEF